MSPTRRKGKAFVQFSSAKVGVCVPNHSLAEIAEVMFFTMSLDDSATLYFDDIELGSQPILCGAGAKP